MVLSQVNLVLEEFAARFLGKVSPVHHFWHTFDIAHTRFSDRHIDQPPTADPVTCEAYSREVISFGFWFGDPSFPEPAFYAYTAPEPAGVPVGALPGRDWPVALATGGCERRPRPTMLVVALSRGPTEGTMDFSAQLDDLQQRAADARAAAQAAVSESRSQLHQRIDQAKVDVNLAAMDARQQVASRDEGTGPQTTGPSQARRNRVRISPGRHAALLDLRPVVASPVELAIATGCCGSPWSWTPSPTAARSWLPGGVGGSWVLVVELARHAAAQLQPVLLDCRILVSWCLPPSRAYAGPCGPQVVRPRAVVLRALHLDPRHGIGINWHLPGNPRFVRTAIGVEQP